MNARMPRLPSFAQPLDGTVMICDEDPAALARTSQALAAPGRVIRPFASVQELLDNAHADTAACMILETRYDSVHGLDLQSMLVARGRQPQVVFLTTCADVTTVVRAMHAGAVDYLIKPMDTGHLQYAVNLALERDGSRRQRDLHSESVLQLLRKLTRRERQVMALVAAGRLNKQIAHALTISEVTVKMHRGQVMRKMGVRSVAELVTMIDRVPGDWALGEPGNVNTAIHCAHTPSVEFASR